MIVLERDHVFTGVFERWALSSFTFWRRCSATNGPFFVLRLIFYSLTFVVFVGSLCLVSISYFRRLMTDSP